MGTRTSKNTYVSWADDCAVPVAHHDIVSILETIRARAVADALLALLELLEQTEVARNCPSMSEQCLRGYKDSSRPLAMVEETKREMWLRAERGETEATVA